MWKLLVFFAFLAVSRAAEDVNPNLINKNVVRTIDLNSQLVKISGTITIENTGKTPVNSYLIGFERDLVGSVSYIGVQESQKNPLKVSQVSVIGRGTSEQFYNVQLRQAIEPGKTSTIIFEVVLTKALNPYPTSIAQKDKQLVRYFGNHYFYSPYPTKTQKTEVLVSARSLENYSKLKPVSQSDSTITYGPYENIDPFSINPLTVHYENNAPFLTVTKVERTIEISHWGNIAVEESIEIRHTGAKLKGSFSRYDYQRDSNTNHHSIKSYRTILPALAHNIYYRDMNGNISTSSVKPRKDYIELELKPRFPLFGGWQSSYILGYSVPSYPYLFKKPSGEFILKIRLLDHIFDDMAVDEVETNIVLPVGVSDVKVKTPYEVKRLPDGVTYKYLDNLGRNVIRASKSNLVEQHIQDIEVTYTWKSHFLLHEPVLVSIALFFIFVVVIIYVRLDFSIGKPEHSKKE
ncbi:dolichyl-diphosphooligosaccharide--protein glycosyltransferase subunit 1 [Anthonomus grandis grandis]|uniref:dolichyl-diphosphooligosaccharide--protein glycosyltransferase subunit 1 n=1 Tax=Anthonomus grandis grandis TaxID=2921223 RepID=UPI0021667A02|nr:dolichyl-diphosphooligosaccharide--protein glycosyltransferase subunit 1 [Anthonomus grandis grandis]